MTAANLTAHQVERLADLRAILALPASPDFAEKLERERTRRGLMRVELELRFLKHLSNALAERGVSHEHDPVFVLDFTAKWVAKAITEIFPEAE